MIEKPIRTDKWVLPKMLKVEIVAYKQAIEGEWEEISKIVPITQGKKS